VIIIWSVVLGWRWTENVQVACDLFPFDCTVQLTIEVWQQLASAGERKYYVMSWQQRERECVRESETGRQTGRETDRDGRRRQRVFCRSFVSWTDDATIDQSLRASRRVWKMTLPGLWGVWHARSIVMVAARRPTATIIFDALHVVVTFRVSRRRREMYCGHPRLCVCVCLSVCPRPYVHTTSRTRM